jgi:hypothetical protein
VDAAAGETLRTALSDPNCYKGTAIQALKSELYALKEKVELDVLKERKAVIAAGDDCADKVAQTAEFQALTPDQQAVMPVDWLGEAEMGLEKPLD